MTPQALVMYAIIASMHVVGLAMLLALVRLVRGPTVPDRILALDTLFVSAIALLVLFGMYLGTAVYFEAALIIAMLGFVGTVVLSKYVLRRDIVESVILPTIPSELRPADPVMHVNPTGRFVTGGPMGDAGLTGRKIIVDTYGGYARHGGGAFSGKDPTKVDRSAAYAARWVAKNVVAAGLADRFEVEVAYGIGIARPVSISVESFGTGRIPDPDIHRLIETHFDLRPSGIIRALDLRQPIYRQTAAYGHFGRADLDLPWERTDKAALLADEAGVRLPEVVPAPA